MNFSRWIRIAFVMLATFSLVVTVLPQMATAQSYSILHEFTGPDGKLPVGTLAMDAAGNLYGTTSGGGINANGTVFMMTKHGSSWTLRTLYRFMGGSDGWAPCSGVTIAPDGSLYGTTSDAGCSSEYQGFNCIHNQGCGTVFRLTPPVSASAALVPSWKKTVIYRFTGGADGLQPLSKVVFDSAGNIYGTTAEGGINNSTCDDIYGLDGCGVVYKLTKGQNGWTESVLFSFDLNNPNGSTGAAPASEVTLSADGRIYGTLYFHGYQGLLYELRPQGSSYTEFFADQRCTESTETATAGVIFDQSGHLFMTTQSGGINGGGTAYELTPDNGTFDCIELWGFSELGPFDTVTMDSGGNLYGTEQWGPTQYGDVFELVKDPYYEPTYLHFFNDNGDGFFPMSGIVRAPDGTLYGETFQGGTDGWGIVFQITP